MKIHIFRQLNGGTNPHYIFVWKVPPLSPKNHEGLVAKAINNSREVAPVKVNAEVISHFNQVVNQISDVPKHVAIALQN